MSELDDYLSELPPAPRAELERIRDVAIGLAPSAEHGRSYGMPALTYRGRPLLSMRQTKEHLAIYPFSSEVIDSVREDLAGFSLSKGTIRFSLEQPLPQGVLERVILARKAQIDGY